MEGPLGKKGLTFPKANTENSLNIYLSNELSSEAYLIPRKRFRAVGSKMQPWNQQYQFYVETY